MAIAYSQDYGNVLNLINTGLSVTQVSRILDISRPTLYKWQNKFKLPDQLPQVAMPHRLMPVHYRLAKVQGICRVLRRQNQEEMSELWGKGSRHTISRGLKS
jgi:transposase